MPKGKDLWGSSTQSDFLLPQDPAGKSVTCWCTKVTSFAIISILPRTFASSICHYWCFSCLFISAWCYLVILIPCRQAALCKQIWYKQPHSCSPLSHTCTHVHTHMRTCTPTLPSTFKESFIAQWTLFFSPSKRGKNCSEYEDKNKPARRRNGRPQSKQINVIAGDGVLVSVMEIELSHLTGISLHKMKIRFESKGFGE